MQQHTEWSDGLLNWLAGWLLLLLLLCNRRTELVLTVAEVLLAREIDCATLESLKLL